MDMERHLFLGQVSSSLGQGHSRVTSPVYALVLGYF